MGKQRAKRRRAFWHGLYREELEKVPETGFRAAIEATMRVPIIARSARFRCSCGRLYRNHSPFSPACAYICSACGSVYRVEHRFDAEAFRNRPNPRLLDWWKIGEAIQIEHMPDPGMFQVPYRTLGDPEYSMRLGRRSGVGLHVELNSGGSDDAGNGEPPVH